MIVSLAFGTAECSLNNILFKCSNCVQYIHCILSKKYGRNYFLSYFQCGSKWMTCHHLLEFSALKKLNISLFVYVHYIIHIIVGTHLQSDANHSF